MVHSARKELSSSQLEHIKLQLSVIVPQLSRAQIFELADLLYDSARARRATAFDESPSWDVRI